MRQCAEPLTPPQQRRARYGVGVHGDEYSGAPCSVPQPGTLSMTSATLDGPLRATTAASVVARIVAYYAVVLALLALVWPHVGRTERAARSALETVLGGAVAGGAVAGNTTLATTVIVAMTGALLFALPVSWIYLLTRAKRGYQQSVVQTLVMLPMVVAGVVVLVKDSLALAFGLAGIVAAVRFRTALDDSKDAVYVFLVTGLGLAAAVDLPVAAAISVLFNATILVLWRTDFGRSPAVLEGRVADERLRRARRLARTGTFVARIDDEVFREMTAEQLEGVAVRAQRRARMHDPEAPSGDGGGDEAGALLLVRTHDVAAARVAVEPLLDAQVKRWRYGGATPSGDSTYVLDYAVDLRKGSRGEDIVELLRAVNAPTVLAVDVG